MNKFSDNLKVTPVETMDLNTVVDYTTPLVDFRESDVALFAIRTSGAWGVGKLTLVVEGVKVDDPPGVGTPAFTIADIVVLDPEPHLYAVNVKAEDIIGLLGDDYPLCQLRMSQNLGEGPTYVTPAIVEDEDHKRFEDMDAYTEVFDRQNTTPLAGGGGGPI